MNPLFSIIVPVYNVERYLAECLDSVLNQDFNSFELICINDGSTDESATILEHYAAKYPRHFKIASQLNMGVAVARNRGIKTATGDYILFLDSDDMLQKGSLQKLSQISQQEQPDIIAFNSKLFFEENSKYQPNTSFNHKNNLIYNTGMDYFCDFVNLRNWGPTGIFYLFKRSLLVGNRLRFQDNLCHEDDLFIPQALYYADKLYTLNEIVYTYRIQQQSRNRDQTEKNYLDKIHIANTLFVFFTEKQYLNKQTKRVIYNLILAGIHGLMNNVKSRKKIPIPSRKMMQDVACSLKEKSIAKMIKFSINLYRTYYKIVK